MPCRALPHHPTSPGTWKVPKFLSRMIDNDRVATLEKDSNSERYSNHDHDHDHDGGKDQVSEFDGDRQGGINCRVGLPRQFFIFSAHSAETTFSREVCQRSRQKCLNFFNFLQCMLTFSNASLQFDLSNSLWLTLALSLWLNLALSGSL